MLTLAKSSCSREAQGMIEWASCSLSRIGVLSRFHHLLPHWTAQRISLSGSLALHSSYVLDYVEVLNNEWNAIAETYLPLYASFILLRLHLCQLDGSLQCLVGPESWAVDFFYLVRVMKGNVDLIEIEEKDNGGVLPLCWPRVFSCFKASSYH